jgi:hypothetical protein
MRSVSRAHEVVLASAQEQRRVLHVARVVLLADQPGAWRRAAMDLVQQAGSRAVGEHRVLAGAQPEYLLQQLDALAHGRRMREGAEVARWPHRARRDERQAAETRAP